MKTKEKDILMICKGHYNDKYKTTYNALKSYQSRYANCDEKYITDSNILSFVLDTVKEFFAPCDWYWLIKDGFIHDIDMAATGLLPRLYPEREIKLSYRYIIDSIIIRLDLLQVRNDEGWIIDLSDYDDVAEII